METPTKQQNSMSIKIFETNAGLGYEQLAYLIRLDKSENGYNYLCIGTSYTGKEDNYRAGDVVENLEDFYVQESHHKIGDFQISRNYLFKCWLAQLYAEKLNQKT